MSDIASELAHKPASPEDDQVLNENSVDPEAVSRLELAVRMAGGATETSRRSGIPLSSLRTYLRGRELRRKALVALSGATGVTLEWLATGLGPMHPDTVISLHSVGGGDRPATAADDAPAGPDEARPATDPASRYVAIPRFDVAASAGGGSTLADHPQVVAYLAFDPDFLRQRLRRKADELGLIEVVGDSMEPTVHHGAILTVDIRQHQPLENGLLYVVRAGDTLLVKRLEVRVREVILHSDNDRYAPEVFRREELDQLHVIGRVVLITAPPR